MSILVAGSLHLDVVVNAPHLPSLDETVTGSDVAYVFGGKGGNQAVAAAQHGAAVSMAGRIGGDSFGAMIAARLQSAGINADQVQRDDGPSGMSAAIVDANGDYGAVIVSAANLRIDGASIRIPLGTHIVLLQNEIPEAVNLAVAQQAKAAGAQVWLNAAPARALSPDLTACIDLLILNRIEAMFYAGEARQTPCITTLGAQGLTFDGLAYPGFMVDPVSSHGAGDCLVGALAARVAAGSSIDMALPYAQAAAALHVSTPPAARANLSSKDVEAFLARP